jgi:hypothetical protein
MPGRSSIGTAELDLLASRITHGEFENRLGCTLEVSTYVWQRNSFEAQQRFEEACEARGIAFEVRQQIGGIEWVCPETSTGAVARNLPANGPPARE